MKAVVTGEADDAEFIRRSMLLEEPPSGCLEALCRRVSFWSALVLLLPFRVVIMLLLIPPLWLTTRLVICLERCTPRNTTGGLAPPPHSALQLLIIRTLWLPWRVILLLVFGIVRIRVRRSAEETPGAARNATWVANHVSTLDGIVIGSIHGHPMTGVCMDYVMKVPVVGATMRAYHMITVSQRSPKVFPEVPQEAEKAQTPTKKVDTPTRKAQTPAYTPSLVTSAIIEYQRLCAKDPRLKSMLAFPEGITHNPNYLVKFQKGAFVSGEPVRPMVLRWPPRMAWVQGAGAHCLVLFTQWFWSVEAVIMPVYVPSEAERSDPQLYADNVQAAMARELGLSEGQVSATIGAKEINDAARAAAKAKAKFEGGTKEERQRGQAQQQVVIPTPAQRVLIARHSERM